jgi:hypothetical protein
MAAKKATEEKVIAIRSLDIQKVPIRIVGDTPLIVHAWSYKAKRQLMGELKISKKEPRNPFYDFVNSMYWLDGVDPKDMTEDEYEELVKTGKARTGFTAYSVKMAGNAAAYRMGWVKNQTGLRGAYFINPLDDPEGDMAEIKGCLPVMREDMVKIGMGTADIRWRPMYENWYMDLLLSYNASGNISLDDIFNIINAGGYCVGIGEWRPEKDGKFGTYHVETL